MQGVGESGQGNVEHSWEEVGEEDPLADWPGEEWSQKPALRLDPNPRPWPGWPYMDHLALHQPFP